ncbi:CHAT domain-containing protein [Spongiactinospora sp. TRM90649]|uniref:CHAT domain-containing protein n=1 Tax=Spongiactinospora sp. TRM90649 TaxID=3031114 RepID=UPI0023F7F788|nr:CHAT domain-containing protein [Spongiactinospora sp. TRM90649]MDF5756968.1 CHAT domain-containing protein [Spongiactinospora sp. TRM90649]
MDTSPSDVAAELLRLAEADPARLTIMATQIADRARARGDFVLASVAARALGVAAVHLEDLGVAARHLRSAIRLAERAGSADLAAEARIRLAFVWCVRGRIPQAMREIDEALPDLHGVGRARAEAQRGVIFNHLKRPEEALASYRLAVPALRRAGDRLWLQRVLSNRGVVHGYRQEFTAAETDLREAEMLCEQLGLGLSLAIVQLNLGWVSATRGEVPAALRYLDLAERRFRELDTHQVCWTLVDRSELLLSVGLTAEAREAAEEAVSEFERRRRGIGQPEARLLLARVAYLEGDHASSVREARTAASGFGRQRRPQWAAMARFVTLRSRVAGGEAVTVQRMERCAADLAAAGWPGSAVEARMMAGQLALGRGWTERGRRELERAGQERNRGPAVPRVRAWHAEALLRLSRGNHRGAAVAIGTALRIHDEHRATLGATDLRAHASRYRVEVADLGLRMAFDSGDAARVLTWAERGRARHLLTKPPRPPDDPYLAESLTQLRAVSGEIHERRAAGVAPGRLVHRQVTLEREIRDYCRRLGGRSAEAATAVSASEVADVLAGRALVEFVHLDDMLHAVTVTGERVRLRRLGPLAPIRSLVDRVPFALRRLASHHAVPGSRAAAAAMLRDAAARLDDALLRPLAADLGDRPLVLIPSGPLQALPWSTLPSCSGRTVSLAPSATLWHAAGRAPASEGPIVAASGPGLPGARTEAEGVASIHSVPAMVDGAATTEAVIGALDGARLAHLAAHGRLHAANPLFSSLRLADGPLTIYDLEQLNSAPQMVVLAACDSGRFVVRAGDELLGLSATFMALGSRAIIAPVLSILDTETTTLMIALHKLLAAGHSAAAALAQAQRQIAGEDFEASAVAAGFVCMGADFALTPPG